MAPPPPASGAGNPVCQRLEAQLASLDRGASDPARADQVRRYEDAANRQQMELDRTVAQSRRMGCEGSGFFLFGGQPQQCGPLNNQIQQMRDNLDRILNDLQRLQGAGADYERDGQRRALFAALARNECGPQYRQAAAAPQSRGLFDTLFGSGSQFQSGPMPSGGYRTICVRLCDGFFFPISFSTTQERFRDDERQCQRMCPAAEVMLFSHRNPGEEVQQAVSVSGRFYTELPNAFKYRQAFDPACSCKRAGETWAEALKYLDERSTLERGDILVTEDRAKAMSLPAQPRAAPQRPGAPGQPAAAANSPAARAAEAKPAEAAPANAAPEPAPADRKAVRSIGPQFYPVR